MDVSIVVHEGLSALVSIAVPLLVVSVFGLAAAVGQAMMAARDESVQYAVRVVTGVGIIAIFGGSFFAALQKVMQVALQ